MTKPLVSILIPHYKTKTLVTLCLRLLRKNTDKNLAKVIVIDNDSQDDSLNYLRSVRWIRLIERKTPPHEPPVHAHARALDLALAEVDTPYVLSIHTDTLVKHPEWLPFLVSQIERDGNIAGVGSWKLETKPLWRQSLKLIERRLQYFYYHLMGQKKHSLEGVGKNYYYLRSHCAMYRTDLLRKFNLHFSDGDLVAGKAMHRALTDKGFEMVFLTSEILIPYLEHINHATTILNPNLSLRKKSIDKGYKRMEKSLALLNAKMILEDHRLDN